MNKSLLPKISGSSGFYKGPRILRVLGPLQKLLLPLIFGSNISLPLNNLLYSMNQQQNVEIFTFKGAEITVSLVLAEKKLYCNAILAIESFLNPL